jgi:hypothetical protein
MSTTITESSDTESDMRPMVAYVASLELMKVVR